MNSHELLKHLAAIFEQERMHGTIIDAGVDKKLIVFLGNDYQNRERILEISAKPQLFTGLPHRPESTGKEYVHITFEVAFPFSVVDTAVLDVSSLLLFINRIVELPGLELDELNGKVFYRYVFLAPGIDEGPFIYLSITGLIMMLLDLFTEAIEAIATGQATFDQLLDQIQELSRVLEKHSQ